MQSLQFDEQGFPKFFQNVPTLKVREPLATFLGGIDPNNGTITYSYLDAVKLAGHSCPTVAGAYLMVLKGLGALYDLNAGELPERGNIEVFMCQSRDEGTTGVIASIATLLTGSATEMGFGGIGMAGRFARRNLLKFDQSNIQGVLALKRRDNGKAVQVAFNSQIVPFGSEMKNVMPKAVSGMATPDELTQFAQLWQERVRAILIDNVDNPELVVVKDM